MNSLRKTITEAVLPLLRESDARAAECDLLFFGTEADICSPLPAKYGLDMLDGIVYNLENRASLFGRPLFSSVSVSGGFIDLTVSDEALTELIRAASEKELLPPSGSIRTGADPAFLHAQLADIANEADEEGPLPLPRGVARRALWHLIMADSASSLAVGLREAEAAVRNHRRARFGTPGCERIAAAAARAMASALQKHIKDNTDWRDDK